MSSESLTLLLIVVLVVFAVLVVISLLPRLRRRYAEMRRGPERTDDTVRAELEAHDVGERQSDRDEFDEREERPLKNRPGAGNLERFN